MMTYRDIVAAVEEGLLKQKQAEITLDDYHSRLDRFKHFDYAHLSNSEVFWIITYASFFALRMPAATVEKKLPELEPHFKDYEKLALLTDTEMNALCLIDFQPRFITLRDLVIRCQNNSRTYSTLMAKHGTFQDYLKERFGITSTFCSDESVAKLQKELKRSFAGIGDKAAWHIITELGFHALKPDSVITRIFNRLGLVGANDGDKEIIQVGRDMSTELSLPIRYLDIIFVKYGQVGKSDLLGTVDGICTEKSPKCHLCGLTEICNYRTGSRLPQESRSQAAPQHTIRPINSETINQTQEKVVVVDKRPEKEAIEKMEGSRYANDSAIARTRRDKLLDEIKSRLRQMEGFHYQITENKLWFRKDYGFEIEGVGEARVKIRVFIKTRKNNDQSENMQTEIRANSNSEKGRLKELFDKLGYDGVQRDNNEAYLPGSWQGSKNMPKTNMPEAKEVILSRIMVLKDILEAPSTESLSQEALDILEEDTLKKR